jgi:hypothetical protein
VSVERLKEYTEIEVEAPWRIEGVVLPEGWPSAGKMEFHDCKYRSLSC